MRLLVSSVIFFQYTLFFFIGEAEAGGKTASSQRKTALPREKRLCRVTTGGCEKQAQQRKRGAPTGNGGRQETAGKKDKPSPGSHLTRNANSYTITVQADADACRKDRAMRRIVLTGGGTAGHVTPNLALAEELTARGYELRYIGSYEGIEKTLITDAGIPYKGISSGKLRRYMNLKNLSDPFRVLKGIGEAKKILKIWRPDVIFSKGGFVAVPVVLAAKKLKIPVVIHESDMTPGLANRICLPTAVRVCCNFPETLKSLPEGKAVLTGCPIRKELLSGSAEAGRAFTGLTGEKPVLMIIGGSLGSVKINTVVREALPQLLQEFQVIHLCGRGNLAPVPEGTEGYVQYEYISEELKDLFALADLAVSRAGANAICELAALRKPNLLIPLSAEASRGDQLLNAESFRKQGFSSVLQEEDLTADSLVTAIKNVRDNQDVYRRAMEKSEGTNGTQAVVDVLEEVMGLY